VKWKQDRLPIWGWGSLYSGPAWAHFRPWPHDTGSALYLSLLQLSPSHNGWDIESAELRAEHVSLDCPRPILKPQGRFFKYFRSLDVFYTFGNWF
jgi:hypothetical protein